MTAAESIKPAIGAEQQVTLLLIEDVSVTAEIERSYFASVGFNVVAGGNVAEAESVIARDWVDIVIIDAAFARRKGIELIPLLLKSARNKEVKVIVTSVSGDISLKKAATAAGASAFIVKPAPRPRYLKEIKKLSAQKARDTERVYQSLEVEVAWNKKSLKAVALDVSSEGIHLAVDAGSSVIELGAPIQLSFSIEGKSLKLQGEVVRHTPKGVGVRFVGVGAQAQRLLDKFLLRYSMEHQASHFYL
ncbi:MAG: Response regulator receiver domain [Pseudomonadota bacterium]|jgi:two-component system chemotaxis response regulator CheY